MAADGDPDPINAGTAGEAALWGGSIAVVGMAANPFGAHRVGSHTADHMAGRYAAGHGIAWGVPKPRSEKIAVPARPLGLAAVCSSVACEFAISPA